MALRHITKISDLSRSEISSVLKLAFDMKKNPSDYHNGKCYCAIEATHSQSIDAPKYSTETKDPLNAL